MDESVFCLEPIKIKVDKLSYDYNYDFLDNLFKTNIENYYNLLLSEEKYKLKNLFNYIFLRSIKINYKFPSFNKIKITKNITPDIFNNEIKNYINKEKVYGIFIINSLKHYYLPNKN